MSGTTLETLRAEYDQIERIDPEGPTYKNLCKFLDSLDNAMLLRLARAKIKWVSMLAINRCTRRGIKL